MNDVLNFIKDLDEKYLICDEFFGSNDLVEMSTYKFENKININCFKSSLKIHANEYLHLRNLLITQFKEDFQENLFLSNIILKYSPVETEFLD